MAAVFGFFILRSRVRGVYFSIVTQAVASAAWLLISRNEMLLGGTNGLTNFYKPFTAERRWIIGLYLLTLRCWWSATCSAGAVTRSRLGRVLVAVRDRESRLYFAGYKPYAFKVFAFAVGAMPGGRRRDALRPAGGVITPQNMDVAASIFMVIWVALGGRGQLWGAVFGALLVNYTKASLTLRHARDLAAGPGGDVPRRRALFPDGFVGLWERIEARSRRARAVQVAIGRGAAARRWGCS